MVASGNYWLDAGLARRPPREAEATRRAIDRMAGAVSGYVGGALLQATVAGITSFIMLWILGVPSPLPLAVVMGLADLVPLVGATIGAVLVGVVTLFTDFPTATIIWAVFAIAYQQFENYVVQPRIQSRAAKLDPFIVVVAAIFGGALLGVIGALLAIPTAAVIQVAAHEYLSYRRDAQQRAGRSARACSPRRRVSDRLSRLIAVQLVQPRLDRAQPRGHLAHELRWQLARGRTRQPAPGGFDQGRGHGGGDHREERDAADHHERPDHAARTAARGDVAVPDRGDRLQRPPQPVAQGGEVLAVGQPADQAPRERDDHGVGPDDHRRAAGGERLAPERRDEPACAGKPQVCVVLVPGGHHVSLNGQPDVRITRPG